MTGGVGVVLLAAAAPRNRQQTGLAGGIMQNGSRIVCTSLSMISSQRTRHIVNMNFHVDFEVRQQLKSVALRRNMTLTELFLEGMQPHLKPPDPEGPI